MNGLKNRVDETDSKRSDNETDKKHTSVHPLPQSERMCVFV